MKISLTKVLETYSYQAVGLNGTDKQYKRPLHFLDNFVFLAREVFQSRYLFLWAGDF